MGRQTGAAWPTRIEAGAVLILRACLFNLLFFGVTAVLCLAYVPLIAFRRRVVVRAVRLWAVIVIWMLRTILGIRHQVRGLENLPDGAAIIAAKHQSAWETIAFNVLLDDAAVVLKKELLRIPVWGWLATHAQHIGIDRKAGAGALRALCAAAAAAAGNGRHILIFPQGTRTPPGGRRPYLPGVAALYDKLDLSVVPVALNSGLFWGRRSFVKRPGLITVEFLPPIPPGLGRRAMMHELESRIEAATARLEAEAAAQFRLATPDGATQRPKRA
jgi:1-acyl-sn-glycerol-3-phosphate acyltransferase